ncbi:hypothetical protein ACIG5E_38775 [Kitasatospora sp. NPDC053057]|uniref:hypothetical protein n=1 Tax=Kitasatospora sp. NPDC053057 TaxID=3364062 RepID=UPI0037CB4B74
MGERRHQEPAVPIGEAEARRLTGALRESVEQMRSAVLVLAERVRAAHRGRVWTALGYPSWCAYAAGELEVSRSMAYRLLDLAAAAEAIEDVVGREAGPQLSHVWDTALSVRAVVEIRGRLAELSDLVAERLAQARAEAGGAQLEPGRISAAVTAAVAELRERPDVPVAGLESSPGPDGYPVARDRLDAHRELGLLALQVAPGYVAERDAEEVLHVLGEEIGSSVEELLACRRYALTGDARATERF